MQTIHAPKYKKKKITQKYTMGRVSCFLHKEGNEDPINLDEIKVTGNPTLNNIILNQKYAQLWFEKKELSDVWIYIIGGLGVLILVVIIIIFLTSGKG